MLQHYLIMLVGSSPVRRQCLIGFSFLIALRAVHSWTDRQTQRIAEPWLARQMQSLANNPITQPSSPTGVQWLPRARLPTSTSSGIKCSKTITVSRNRVSVGNGSLKARPLQMPAELARLSRWVAVQHLVETNASIALISPDWGVSDCRQQPAYTLWQSTEAFSL